MPHAMLPVVTILALRIGWILGGAVTVEFVFGRPGLGSLLIRALRAAGLPGRSGLSADAGACRHAGHPDRRRGAGRDGPAYSRGKEMTGMTAAASRALAGLRSNAGVARFRVVAWQDRGRLSGSAFADRDLRALDHTVRLCRTGPDERKRAAGLAAPIGHRSIRPRRSQPRDLRCPNLAVGQRHGDRHLDHRRHDAGRRSGLFRWILSSVR